MKFTVEINLEWDRIVAGYNHYYGYKNKKPTKKDIALWMALLAESDILDCASHDEDDE